MTSVMAVSNTILSMSFQESIPVTPLKLYWLLYLLYREYLQKYDIVKTVEKRLRIE